MPLPEGSIDLSPDYTSAKALFPGGAPQDDMSSFTRPGAPALSNTAQMAYGNVLAYGLPGVGVGLLDTIGQSLGVLKNSSVPDFLKAHTGQGENSFGDFYARNQQPLRTAGEIAGMFLPGLAAMKILKVVRVAREAGQMGEILQGARSLDVLLGNSAELSAAEARVAEAATTTRADAGIWAGRSVLTPEMRAARAGYYGVRALDAVRSTAAFEFGNRAVFNSSSTFYPADYTLTDQLKWAGLGLAGGFAIEGAMARYAIRQLTQNVQGRMAMGAAADVFALSPYEKVVPNVIFRPQERGLGLTVFSSLRADLLQTASISTTSTALRTNLKQDEINIQQVMNKQIGMLAYDTHPILPRTTLGPEQLDLAQKALQQTNTLFLYGKKLAQIPADGAKEFYSTVSDYLEKARRQFAVDSFAASTINDPVRQSAELGAINRTLAEAEATANQVHMVIEQDGRFNIYKNRADNWLDTNAFDSIKRKGYTTQTPSPGDASEVVTLKNSKLLLKGDNNIVLHDNFVYEMPAGATPMDFSALYAAGSYMINEWKPVENQVFTLTPKVNWRTTEMTLALLKAKPEIAPLIKFGGGFTSADDAAFHVLNSKFQDFNKLMDVTERQPLVGPLAKRIKSAKVNYTPAQVVQRLNLPEPNGLQNSPLYEMFAHARLQGMDDLYDMFPVTKSTLNPSEYTNMDLLQAHLRETAGITDAKYTFPVQGVLLNQTNDTKPLFLASTAIPSLSRSDSEIAGAVQAMRDVQLERLAQIDPKQAPLVTSVINEVVTGGNEGGDLSGAANQARAVQLLHDGMLSGTAQVVYQDRINEQFPTLKAMQLVVQRITKFIDGHVGRLAEVNLTPKMANMLSAKGRPDLIDFNRVEQSYRHGWDIEGIEPNPMGEGVVFRLKQNSAINQQLMQYHFRDHAVEGGLADAGEDGLMQFMPDMSVTGKKVGYQPLVVSQNAADLAKSISDLSIQSGRENNALRSALGSNPIKLRDFHLPTPELSRNGSWFVRNSAGNVVYTYTGDLETSNKSRAFAAATQLTNASGEPHYAVALETVQRDHSVNDHNFFDVVDYSDQIVKNGLGISGGLARTEVDTGPSTLRAMVASLQQQFLNVGLRSNAAVFEPELNYARQAAQTTIAGRENAGALNIFDRYIATVFNRVPTSTSGDFTRKGSVISNLYGTIEGASDRFLSYLNSIHSEFGLPNSDASVSARLMRTFLRKQSSEEEFRQFANTMPEWSPFKTANDWAESTFREKMPWTTRGVAATLAKTSSTLALRFMDVGTAVNNFAGLLTNMPSVVYALRRLPNETHDQWISRTAAWGTQYADGIMTFSPEKAVVNAISAFWRGELTADMGKAAAEGMFDPEYFALARVLTEPVRSKGGQQFDAFVRTASVMADKSEMISRKIAWGMGLKIGRELHGFTDDRNAYIFANNFVNDMIGNYNPSNKPTMFSGAVGMTLGAFQTYMFNFYRRLYGYVERGDRTAIIAQYAAQASLFGFRSVPGYSLWNSAMTSNQMGGDSFTDHVNKNLPPGVGDLLLNGTISNIPKLFGSSSGLAFYTRGSVDFTQLPPTILDFQKAPPITFLANVFTGVKATINNIFGAGGFSTQQQEEILARFSTNRALRSIAELAADARTDQKGLPIELGTRDALHIAAALLGTQTSYARQQQDAYNSERMVQMNQADLRETLNDKTRSLIRGGEFNTADIQALVHSYISSGGNPAYLGSWFRDMFTTSMTPKASLKMQELARSGKLIELEDMLAALQQNQNPPQ